MSSDLSGSILAVTADSYNVDVGSNLLYISLDGGLTWSPQGLSISEFAQHPSAVLSGNGGMVAVSVANPQLVFTGFALNETALCLPTVTDGIASSHAGHLTNLVLVSSQSITDGTASLSEGLLTSLVIVSSSSITDGTASLSSGTLSGISGSFSNIVSAATLSDGTASLNAGQLTSLSVLALDVGEMAGSCNFPISYTIISADCLYPNITHLPVGSVLEVYNADGTGAHHFGLGSWIPPLSTCTLVYVGSNEWTSSCTCSGAYVLTNDALSGTAFSNYYGEYYEDPDSMCASADMSKIVIVGADGNIYTSIDDGITWKLVCIGVFASPTYA